MLCICTKNTANNPGTSIRVSQALAAASCILAAAVLVYFMLKPPAKPLFVRRAAEDTETTEGGTEDE